MKGLSPLEQFLRTDERDAGCAETLELLDRYVERQMAHGDAAEHLPGIAVHLQTCGPCVQDYQGLLAALAALGPDDARDDESEIP
jgi:hypothetical protein